MAEIDPTISADNTNTKPTLREQARSIWREMAVGWYAEELEEDQLRVRVDYMFTTIGGGALVGAGIALANRDIIGAVAGGVMGVAGLYGGLEAHAGITEYQQSVEQISNSGEAS